MAEQRSGSEARSGRSPWLGYVQLILILVVIAVALYFARAPERVEREAASDLTAERAQPAVSVIRPVPTAQALTVRLTGTVNSKRRSGSRRRSRAG